MKGWNMWTHCSLQNRNASTLVLRTYVIEMLKATAKKLKDFISSLFAIIILIPFFPSSYIYAWKCRQMKSWAHHYDCSATVQKRHFFSTCIRLMPHWWGNSIDLVRFGEQRLWNGLRESKRKSQMSKCKLCMISAN